MTVKMIPLLDLNLSPEQEPYTQAIAAIFDRPQSQPVEIDPADLAGDLHECRELAADLAAYRELALVALAEMAVLMNAATTARASVRALRAELGQDRDRDQGKDST
jgi:hypothetical protein